MIGMIARFALGMCWFTAAIAFFAHTIVGLLDNAPSRDVGLCVVAVVICVFTGYFCMEPPAPEKDTTP